MSQVRAPFEPIARYRLIRRPEVTHVTSLSTSRIYALMREGTFPQCVKTGERSVAWREEEVLAWVAQRTSGGPAPAALNPDAATTPDLLTR